MVRSRNALQAPPVSTTAATTVSVFTPHRRAVERQELPSQSIRRTMTRWAGSIRRPSWGWVEGSVNVFPHGTHPYRCEWFRFFPAFRAGAEQVGHNTANAFPELGRRARVVLANRTLTHDVRL